MFLKLRIRPLEWKRPSPIELTKWQRKSNRTSILKKFPLMRFPPNYSRFPVTSLTKPVTELEREERLKLLLQQVFLPSRLKNRKRHHPDLSGVSQNVTGLEAHNGRTEKNSNLLR